jgi:predicted phosphodiesterase
MSKSLGEAIKETKKADTPESVIKLLADHGVNKDDIGSIKSISLSSYQSLIKNDDGDPEVVDLSATKILISPQWEEGPKWPLIQQSPPVNISAPKPPKKAPSLVGGWEVAVCLPDPQIGFRRFEDGSMDPFHDDAAMDVAIQVLSAMEHETRVQQVVNLGDFLDLPQQGKFAQEPYFANTTQAAIDRGGIFLAEQRAAAPNAKLVVIEGNHDARLQKFVQLNAMAAFGLKKANLPESWPVMSLPYLMRLDELGDCVFLDGWPAATWWINDKLRAIHGDKVRSNGSTASAYMNDMPHVSTIFGHIHRQEIQSKTTFDRMGKIKSMAISPGCLCRVDGHVPSVKSGQSIDGRPITYYENWQQGLSVITYKPEGSFHVDLVHIDDGKTLYRGQEFISRKVSADGISSSA